MLPQLRVHTTGKCAYRFLGALNGSDTPLMVLGLWEVGGGFYRNGSHIFGKKCHRICREPICSSEEEGSSEPVKDESVMDQKSDPVSETGDAIEKIEDDVKSKEAEVITEKSTDKAASEEKVTIYPPKLETVRIDDDGTALVAGMVIQDLY